MGKENEHTFEGWSKAIASINLTQTVYVLKDAPEVGRHKIISVAKEFHNPENVVVTFYNMRDEEGKVHYLMYNEFLNLFDAIQV